LQASSPLRLAPPHAPPLLLATALPSLQGAIYGASAGKKDKKEKEKKKKDKKKAVAEADSLFAVLGGGNEEAEEDEEEAPKKEKKDKKKKGAADVATAFAGVRCAAVTAVPSQAGQMGGRALRGLARQRGRSCAVGL